MAWNDYVNFSELDQYAAADFAQCVADEKAGGGPGEDGITADSLATYLDILVKVFEQSTELDFVPGGRNGPAPIWWALCVGGRKGIFSEGYGFHPPRSRRSLPSCRFESIRMA